MLQKNKQSTKCCDQTNTKEDLKDSDPEDNCAGNNGSEINFQGISDKDTQESIDSDVQSGVMHNDGDTNDGESHYDATNKDPNARASADDQSIPAPFSTESLLAFNILLIVL